MSNRLLSSLALLSLASQLCAADLRPNIVVILADDMGYADIGVHGCTDIPTPNIDRIAIQGVRFTDAYANGSFCTPTRAALMSCRYQQRSGNDDLDGVTGPLPLGICTLPDRMRAAGYTTGMVGKWHLGGKDGYTPLDRGFDEFFGFLGGGHYYLPNPKGKGSYYAPIFRNRQPVDEQRYLTDAFGEEAAAHTRGCTMNDRSVLSRRGFVAAGVSAVSAAGTVCAADVADALPTATRAAQPLAPNFTVVHRRANPRTYVEGCGLIVLPDRSILAVVPVVPRGGIPKKGPTEINYIRSDDGGKTWTTVSQLPFYSAVPFLHDDRLYTFLFSMGTQFRNDDVYLAASDDRGETWTEPAKIFNGHFWTCQTSMVVRDQRLYWAIDDQQPDHSRHRSPRAIVGDLSADLMDPASWRISNFVPFPGTPNELLRDEYDINGLGIWNMPDHWLEANVVEVGGRLRLQATVKSQWQTLSNLCGICDLKDDGTELTMTFRQFHPMTGGQLKFAITRDEPSSLFWATANFVVDGQESQDWWDEARRSRRFNGMGGNDRRFLMLLYSVDALNWFQAGCVAQAETLRQSFMYGTPVVDGDDLLVISRTSINAFDQHDADHATFHRIRNFCSLALNLFPKRSAI